MIVVRYEEAVKKPTTGSISYTVLGAESYDGVEEVLLPLKPSQGKPIFFTKKFLGRSEYRWEVLDVGEDSSAAVRTYYVILNQRDQVDKADYLQKIVTAPRHGVFTLNEWAIVEVDFGHHLDVGKENGHIRSNKRYVDTQHRLSMPKRRLAIVTKVVSRVNHELVQVIPISSRQPHLSDNTCVDVTRSLSQMVHYQKQSWAVCQMIEAVPASRILAPLIKRVAHAPAVRDQAFTNRLHAATRPAVKDAMMHAVNAAARVKDTRDLVSAKKDIALLKAQAAAMQTDINLYERFVKDMDSTLTLASLRSMYP